MQMNLLVLSHKETWPDSTSPTGYATVGGFPFQIQAISELFDQTRLIVPLRATPPPYNVRHLIGHNLHVKTLDEPAGADLRRKLAMLTWLPRHFFTLWQAVRMADAIHTPVPSDIGLIGILITLIQQKPLFIRHCGTWGKQVTLADRFLLWLLEKVAGGRNVVLATGWNDTAPSRRNPNIHWIFSTTLTNAELLSLPECKSWQPSIPLRLVTVGRLVKDKNIQAVISAIPSLQVRSPDVVLEVVGEGEYRSELEKLVSNLSVTDRVIFHGNVSHEKVFEILSRCHLFIFPSFREGFPKALLEALACGMPVVASNTSVIPFLIRDCGILLDIPDAGHISKAVSDLLDDPVLLQVMSNRARQTAHGYTLESWQRQIRDHLSSSWKVHLYEHA
jgi:glycosyltransferase involved in cell wall biosynthesis